MDGWLDDRGDVDGWDTDSESLLLLQAPAATRLVRLATLVFKRVRRLIIDAIGIKVVRSRSPNQETVHVPGIGKRMSLKTVGAMASQGDWPWVDAIS